MNSLLLVIVGVVLLFILVSGIFSIWRKVPQDKALVITGLKKRVITGGGGFVIPFLERTDAISLENMNIPVSVTNSLTSTGVPLDVTGTVIVKILSTDSSILNAMEQFNTGDVESTIKNIKETVCEVMEGKLREIVSSLDVEKVYKDREQFSVKVQEVALADLSAMGLEIKTFTIRELSDQNGYLDSLKVKQTSSVKREAAIARAEAERDTKIKIAEANRVARERELASETIIAEAEKENALKINEYRREQETSRAKADIAYSIEENIRLKEVTQAEMEVDIKRKEKEIELAQQETVRKAEFLKAEVEKTSEADKFRAIKQAEAQKAARIAQAEADAETTLLNAEAEAKAIRLKGEAEAEAIRLKGEAQAEAMKKQADAYKEYGEAAILQLMVEKLPEIAQAIASPLSQTEKIVIMDQGGENGGAAKIPAYVNTIAGMVPEAIKALTGKDMMDIAERALTKTHSVNTYVGSDNTVIDLPESN